MANPVTVSIFEYPDPSLIILKHAAGGSSSELLKNRLVSKALKECSDTLIEGFWKELHQANPEGPIDITQAMEVIDQESATGAPAIFKFAKLLDVFRKRGYSLTSHPPIVVHVDDFQKLQYDLALQKIWPRLRRLPEFLAQTDLPGDDANSQTIRLFLHARAWEEISTLDLKDLDLKILPPELKLFTGLRKIELQGNQLKDISYLTAFTKLTVLWLSDNELEDITCLGALINLKTLGLSRNRLKDVTPLGGLINLTGLWLRENQLKGIAPLGGLINLTELWLNYNQLKGAACLTALINLKGLGLSNNQLEDLSSLRTLIRLVELDISSNPVSDYSFLIFFANLKILKLNVDFEKLKDLSDLNECPLTNPISLIPLQSLKALQLDQVLPPILDT